MIFSSGQVVWIVLLLQWSFLHHATESFVPNFHFTLDRRRELDSLSPSMEPSESSSLLPYISNYLNKKTHPSFNETNSFYDHFMIAIPMDVRINSELLLELESIQRAIIFHCPLTVHSCLSTLSSATLRVPLLYLSIPPSRASSSSGRQQIMPTLVNIVQAAMQKVPALDPLLQLPCHSLEIEGGTIHVAHEVLSVRFGGNATLEEPWHHVVQELQQSLQHLFPEAVVRTPMDPLRMPFMRLPPDWNDFLREQYRQLHGSDDFHDTTDDSMLLLTADQGGNGISPIHWEQYANDQFSQQRFSSLAIYSHLPPSVRMVESNVEWTERQFPAISALIPLGEATTTPTPQEAQFAAYQEQRVVEAEAIWKKEVQENAQRFQTNRPASRGGSLLEPLDSSANSNEDFNSNEHDVTNNFDQSQRKIPPSFQDTRRIVASRARVIQERLDETKVLKKPQDRNPIFEQYRNKTLVPSDESTTAALTIDLPVFPSRECCVGVWRMIRSPTGFDVQDGDDNTSDNLILRVDGHIAGGPILDPSCGQKAAGGEWTYSSSDRWLRVRFLIPPLKQRVLVMEGRLELLSMKPALPLAGNTFGIPELESLSFSASSEVMDDRIICSGSVWMEDVGGYPGRDDVGTFTMIKSLPPLDMSQISITIPKNVRNID